MTATMEQFISLRRSRGNLREAADEILREFWNHFVSRLQERVSSEHMGEAWTVLNPNQADDYLPLSVNILLDNVKDERDSVDNRMVFQIAVVEFTEWFILEWIVPSVHRGLDADRY